MQPEQNRGYVDCDSGQVSAPPRVGPEAMECPNLDMLRKVYLAEGI